MNTAEGQVFHPGKRPLPGENRVGPARLCGHEKPGMNFSSRVPAQEKRAGNPWTFCGKNPFFWQENRNFANLTEGFIRNVMWKNFQQPVENIPSFGGKIPWWAGFPHFQQSFQQ
ncbi:hypothetical protein H6B15_05115 [Gemmiger formicilis]|nr:hypothetical protein [Gemmiger formicilis]